MNNVLDEDAGLFFMQNQCAQSQYGTNRMLRESNIALNEAKRNQNVAEMFHVGSGIYALEKEIVTYGKKFSAAVKTYAVIENVEDAFKTINNQATSLDSSSREDIKKIENNIEDARKLMMESISKACKTYFPDPGNDGLVTKSDAEFLHISPNLIKADIGDTARRKIEEILKWRIMWGGEKINVHKSDEKKITDMLNGVLSDYQTKFVKKRELLLENKRDGFIESVQKAFKSNGGLSRDVLDLLLDITTPQIDSAKLSREKINVIFNDLIVNSAFFKIPQMPKEEFINKTVIEILDSSQDVIEYLAKDYLDEGKRISDVIAAEYNDNLDTYSTLLHGLIESREKMQEIGARIHKVADKIGECTTELEEVIWKEENSHGNK